MKAVKNLISAKLLFKFSLIKLFFRIYFFRSYRYLQSNFRSSKIEPSNITKYASNKGHTFFGYYDLCPFSKNNKLLLAVVSPKRNRPPTKTDEIFIGYFDKKNNENFNIVDKTSTWCWQMGCRLQWHPENENQIIIYNKMVDRNYGSVVQDIKSHKILRSYKKPIYQIDKTGNWGLSLNFSRLQRLRPGYGYSNIEDFTTQEKCPKADGVWRINLKTGKSQLILSLKDLSKIDSLPSMESAEHYVNHLAFNPSGNRFMFFHLWVKNGKRYNRMITSDIEGNSLCVLESKGKISHYTWKSDSELLATVRYQKTDLRYQLYQHLTDNFSPIQHKDFLFQDGHPSYSPDGKYLLTDTYPDKFAEQHLLLCNFERNCIEINRFFSPIIFRGEVRCDLHPRWDRSGKHVCFDSACDGRRAIYVIELYNV